MRSEAFYSYLDECRTLVVSELQNMLPRSGAAAQTLYELMYEYPLRDAKALRPALCIATCRALGGALESALPSAVVLELYHNAFLIHDDIEDGSEVRRGGPTLHRMYGAPIALNVADAMLAVALEPLLANTELLCVAKALHILQVVARMARESAEGQAQELAWIRQADWSQRDLDYVRMAHKKTTHYSFLAPMAIGAIVAGAPHSLRYRMTLLATALGAAFQIRDDTLNLEANAAAYDKDLAGDIWEGKRTLALLHALRCATPSDRERALAILRKPRPTSAEAAPDATARLLAELVRSGDLSETGAATLREHWTVAGAAKTREDVDFLLQLIQRSGSIEYARAIGRRYAARAKHAAERLWSGLSDSVHKRFLFQLTEFVVEREH
jgi:geranylgeranyl diphosphate synthase type II